MTYDHDVNYWFPPPSPTKENPCYPGVNYLILYVHLIYLCIQKVWRLSYIIGPGRRGIREIFFRFLHKNILWYSLEAPYEGASNEYHSIYLCGEIRKISTIFWLKKKAPYLEYCTCMCRFVYTEKCKFVCLFVLTQSTQWGHVECG